jgi:hypothetical protein
MSNAQAVMLAESSIDILDKVSKLKKQSVQHDPNPSIRTAWSPELNTS